VGSPCALRVGGVLEIAINVVHIDHVSLLARTGGDLIVARHTSSKYRLAVPLVTLGGGILEHFVRSHVAQVDVLMLARREGEREAGSALIDCLFAPSTPRAGGAHQEAVGVIGIDDANLVLTLYIYLAIAGMHIAHNGGAGPGTSVVRKVGKVA